MEHLAHLQKNKKQLELRFAILKLIREFFWSQGFTEVESPAIVRLPGQEPNLSPMSVIIHNERGEKFFGYLHTSPEYTMKKMLAAGWKKIFYLGKCYRDYESFGGMHNPEFTMLEFYRTGVDMFRLMDDLDRLFNFIYKKLRNWEIKKLGNFERVEMRELWRRFVDVNLDDYLDEEKMFDLCVGAGLKPACTENYEELFYRIFLNKIEPNLKGPTIIYHYPAKMAALSRLSPVDPRYAERFEVYFDGLELANAFSELTNADEQLKRLQAEQIERKRLGKTVYDIDIEFIEALKTMPESAGVALGVDRLVQVFQDCKNIDDVITLPASKLFKYLYFN